MRKNFELTLYEDSAELVVGATNEAIEVIASRLAEKRVFHIALTGGPLGTEFAQKLVKLINHAGDLTGLNIWFSDERFDTSDSPLRNSRPVRDGLINFSVTVHEVMSSDEGVSVYEAANSYEAQLRDVTMDLCILGLGFDGHVASLFPMHWNSQETEAAIAVADSPKPPPERVSFSMAFINSSDQVWIIASGKIKAVAAKAVLEADTSVPAGHVQAAGLTRLFLDSEAFSNG
ncbi:MAG: 6-phosphogluconolactonase [Candidatus Planktophila sp.]|nr:6-phosphogluconolactonase [Candidatus Planktophila sp.]